MTTRKTTPAADVDFDFDKDRTPVVRRTIRFDGHTYSMPGKLSLMVAHHLNLGEVVEAAQILFGKDDAKTFLASDQADVDALAEIVSTVYGTPVGESPASPS